MRDPILQLSYSHDDRAAGQYTATFVWNWEALRGIHPEAEGEHRVHALKALLRVVRRSYPRIFVLTNDEASASDRFHRHLEGVSGSLDPLILSTYASRVVPLEYGWGRLETGAERWSFLIDLRDQGLDTFTRELLGMSMNPICYNFLFARASCELETLVPAMAVPESASGETLTAEWERSVLKTVGAILYPREETFLTLKTTDNQIMTEVLAAYPPGKAAAERRD